ncbi:MAG: hypothetical protein HOC91_16675 [Nitrospinaceae bacterium]|nr:hypothetical protein [Nitrospinaceae bacterium]MBT3435459.1 hypothetical protein [Nitrospinaceae bacterium]MBT4432146.1 hypothetical protein [Nitrospinaceae bacterium]MBT6394484.1 hypothetical protein [Nitrospinaceae bacterium]MBT7857695.1 hypothetical protein [Nitrospinaceae bacterium]
MLAQLGGRGQQHLAGGGYLDPPGRMGGPMTATCRTCELPYNYFGATTNHPAFAVVATSHRAFAVVGPPRSGALTIFPGPNLHSRLY